MRRNKISATRIPGKAASKTVRNRPKAPQAESLKEWLKRRTITLTDGGRRGKKSDIDPDPRDRSVPFSRSRAATQMSLKIAAFLIRWSFLPPHSTPTWSGLLLPTGNHYTHSETLHQSPPSPELHLPPIRRCADWLLATASLNSLHFSPKVSRFCSV